MAIFGITYIMLWVLAVIGWIANIVTIVNHVNDPMSTLIVLRIVGIFAVPFGSILGYF